MTGDSERSAEAPCINPGKIFALLSTKPDRQRLQGHANSLSAQEWAFEENEGRSKTPTCWTWLYREVRRPSRCSSCPFKQVSTSDRNGCWLRRDMLQRGQRCNYAARLRDQHSKQGLPSPHDSPFLLLAVPLFAGWWPQMLSFLQFFSSSFQHMALHWRWKFGDQRGHQPNSWSLQGAVTTQKRKAVCNPTYDSSCLRDSSMLRLHLPEDGFGFVAGWCSTCWATEIVDSIASRTSRAGLCWLLEYLNSGLGYIFQQGVHLLEIGKKRELSPALKAPIDRASTLNTFKLGRNLDCQLPHERFSLSLRLLTSISCFVFTSQTHQRMLFLFSLFSLLPGHQPTTSPAATSMLAAPIPAWSHWAETHVVCSLLNHQLQLQRGLPHGPLVQILQHTHTSYESLSQFKLCPQPVPSAPMMMSLRLLGEGCTTQIAPTPPPWCHIRQLLDHSWTLAGACTCKMRLILCRWGFSPSSLSSNRCG